MFGASQAIAIDPNNPNYMYIDSGDHGAFRSEDGGTVWYRANSGLDHYEHIYDITIDPDTSEVYLTDCERETSSVGSIAKSTDNGQSWTNIDTGLADTTYYAIAIDTNSPQAFFAQ